MTNSPGAGPAGNDPGELREQVRRTREQLGETVEALAAKVDLKARAEEKAAHAKDEVQHRTAQVLHLVHGDRTPEHVQTAGAEVARTSRSNRGPVLVAAGVVVAVLAVMVVRRRQSGRWC
jgi:hypothetical protein